MVYHADYLWSDSMGEREAANDKQDQLPRWNNSRPDVFNRDGTKSHYRMVQPSDARIIELQEPFEAGSATRQAEALRRSQVFAFRV